MRNRIIPWRRAVEWWLGLRTPLRVVSLAVVGVAAGLTVGAIAVGGSGSAEEPAPVSIVVATATATPAPTATATPAPSPTVTPTASPTASPTPEPTAEPGPATITSIAELTALYGEAPDATYGRLRIPAIGVDAPLGMRVVGIETSVMQNPTGPADVVWYDLSAWGALGGRPGEGKNAIFSGHVDFAAYVDYADSQFRGVGVFASIDLLSPGDVIEIEVDGETMRYAVVWRRQVPAASSEWAGIFSSDVEVDSITIYTCGGTFDFSSGSYLERTVVRAERI